MFARKWHRGTGADLPAKQVLWTRRRFDRQRLGGTVSELEIVIRQFESDVRKAGEEVQSVLEKMSKNPENFYQNMGRTMEAHYRRLQRL